MPTFARAALRHRLPLFAALLTLAACGSPSGPPVDLARFTAGEVQYPGAVWPTVDDPETLGWSASGLAAAHQLYDSLESDAFMAVHRGVPVVSWGDVAARYNGQSVRKSLLGALIGQEVEAGRLQLDRTLAELEIDDDPPLTAGERQATLDDLLHSRSGVYHSALYEAGSWKRQKPERGSQPPGALWYYNNWDFNALGTLFERSAGSGIGDAFRTRIAEPTGMQDFRSRDVVYLTRDSLTEKIQHNASDHAAYVFMISARDLARFGLLYLSGGRWQETQVVPAEWVEASWQGVSVGGLEQRLGEGVRYGNLWWVYPAEVMGGRPGTTAYIARGNRGHWLVVIPDLELVLVHRVATGGVGLAAQLKRRYLGTSSVDDQALMRLLAKVIAAHPAMASG